MGSTTSVKLEVTPNVLRTAKGSFLILLWLSILEFPLYVVGTGIDASWARALGYFFTRQMQAGVDFIFTYGPLGFLNTGAYVQDLFWLRYGYQILLQLLLVYYLSTSVNEKIKPGIWLVCFAFFIVFLGGAHGDDQKLFFIALIGIHLIDDKKTLFSILFSLFILGVLSLTKFTFFGLSVFVVLCAEAHGRLKNLKSLFSPLLLFLLIYFLIYFLAGQSFCAFPTYIKGAIEISSGYNKSMVLEGPPVETLQALVILGVIVMMILGTLRSANRNSIVKLHS